MMELFAKIVNGFLIPSQIGSFRCCSGMGEVTPYVTHPRIMKLGTVTTNLKDDPKKYKSDGRPFQFC